MKRFLSLLMMCLLACTFAWATPAWAAAGKASLIRIKATHPRPVHHHAHKAGKHHTPKRHRHKI
jgi:hypothetical protein